ncbi:hypothetical protein [Thermonema rossianum]|uniref:hypothetical protein n=1 Tax=Thermonema rossianum TaxID=55505 RepID=UPI0012FB7F37|nr:hypothetical protein [Thermonema rossianum]
MAASTLYQWVLYFHHFRHPLSLREIQTLARSLNLPADSYKTLLANGLCELRHGHIALTGETAIIKERLRTYRRTRLYRCIAICWSFVLKQLPFVKAVFVSGSLSKNHVKAGGDIDFFVITKRKRLWVVYFLFRVLKTICWGGRSRFFCYNYLLDEDHLQLPACNEYIAMEVWSLVPMYDPFGMYGRLWEANPALKAYLLPPPVNKPFFKSRSRLQQLFEWLLPAKAMQTFNDYWFRLIYKRWQKKYGQCFHPVEGIDIREGVFKGHMKPHYRDIHQGVQAVLCKYKALKTS